MNEGLDLERKQKAMKQKYLKKNNQSLHAARKNKNGRISHNMIINIVKDSKYTFAWISRNAINKSLKNNAMQQEEKMF